MTAMLAGSRWQGHVVTQRAARLAVDRWVYGRSGACTQAIDAASIVSGDAGRLAVACLLASLSIGDLIRLGIVWASDSLRDQLLVAADRLMAAGIDVGETVALALGRWQAGDWRGADKAIAYLNAQPRMYNVEAVDGDAYARGMVARVEWPRREQVGMFDQWNSDVQESDLRMLVRDLASWREISRARNYLRVSISNGSVTHVMTRGVVSSWRIERQTLDLVWLDLTLQHDDVVVVDGAWPVAGWGPRP